MNDLGFVVLQRPHSAGETIPWIKSDAGVLRRATPEEAALWEALAEARERLEAHEAKGRKKG